jgi:hypothetical protein
MKLYLDVKTVPIRYKSSLCQRAMPAHAPGFTLLSLTQGQRLVI